MHVYNSFNDIAAAQSAGLQSDISVFNEVTTKVAADYKTAMLKVYESIEDLRGAIMNAIDPNPQNEAKLRHVEKRIFQTAEDFEQYVEEGNDVIRSLIKDN